ncbi:dienelactone hydrolase family protein [Pelomonas sp. V22]|uniref:dienelactone hydrolase family protein n=1 Tax=Pelomonas sp. V22 TaxID=2822139 RepID=UPI0024A96A67|nr:dienelactone hydrolase family protein [Pelomonas sp. V22]MDI4633142.1 dienelactone hydrolase family protein [Pelomonas sp. V22]
MRKLHCAVAAACRLASAALLRMIGATSLTLATLLFGQSAAGAQTLSASTQGRIEFDSFTPATMFDLARERRERWERVRVWGELTLPRRPAGRVPAMILMHGSAGVTPAQRQWVDAFKDLGIATFEVNTFAPRGITDTVADQGSLNESAHVMDAFKALEVLAGHPGIDGQRIGIIGFSRGGSAAFRTAIEPLRKAVIKSDLAFSLHVPVYAGCNQVYWSPKLTGAPLLNLVGEADDYTTAAPCLKLASRYEAAGSRVRSVAYPDAHHAWDAIIPVTWLPNASSASSCGVVRWDIEEWRITAEATGKELNGSELGKFFSDCSKRGVHVGRNSMAFRASMDDVSRFLKVEFGL